MSIPFRSTVIKVNLRSNSFGGSGSTRALHPDGTFQENKPEKLQSFNRTDVNGNNVGNCYINLWVNLRFDFTWSMNDLISPKCNLEKKFPSVGVIKEAWAPVQVQQVQWTEPWQIVISVSSFYLVQGIEYIFRANFFCISRSSLCRRWKPDCAFREPSSIEYMDRNYWLYTFEILMMMSSKNRKAMMKRKLLKKHSGTQNFNIY